MSQVRYQGPVTWRDHDGVKHTAHNVYWEMDSCYLSPQPQPPQVIQVQPPPHRHSHVLGTVLAVGAGIGLFAVLASSAFGRFLLLVALCALGWLVWLSNDNFANTPEEGAHYLYPAKHVSLRVVKITGPDLYWQLDRDPQVYHTQVQEVKGMLRDGELKRETR